MSFHFHDLIDHIHRQIEGRGPGEKQKKKLGGTQTMVVQAPPIVLTEQVVLTEQEIIDEYFEGLGEGKTLDDGEEEIKEEIIKEEKFLGKIEKEIRRMTDEDIIEIKKIEVDKKGLIYFKDRLKKRIDDKNNLILIERDNKRREELRGQAIETLKRQLGPMETDLENSMGTIVNIKGKKNIDAERTRLRELMVKINKIKEQISNPNSINLEILNQKAPPVVKAEPVIPKTPEEENRYRFGTIAYPNDKFSLTNVEKSFFQGVKGLGFEGSLCYDYDGQTETGLSCILRLITNDYGPILQNVNNTNITPAKRQWYIIDISTETADADAKNYSTKAYGIKHDAETIPLQKTKIEGSFNFIPYFTKVNGELKLYNVLDKITGTWINEDFIKDYYIIYLLKDGVFYFKINDLKYFERNGEIEIDDDNDNKKYFKIKPKKMETEDHEFNDNGKMKIQKIININGKLIKLKK